MAIKVAFIAHLLLCFSLVNIITSRPPSPISYFPNHYHHPWSKDDYSDKDSFMSPSDYSINDIPDGSNLKKEFRPLFPVFSSYQDGFVPSDLTALDKVYWWKKRFPNYRSGPVEDIPYFDDGVSDNSLDGYISGGVNKRDYTAAQLVNMLKAIAKARRQRQIRIAGKGLRFGISK